MIVLADRYALLEQVGEGGMGAVWRAHDAKLERDVAIKLLHSFVANDPEQRRRFGREARTLAGLANDHIVRVYDYVDTEEQAFLVMEYVDGVNLAEATFGRLPLPPAEAAAYAAPVARALAYAHAKGIVHRDLTPANILIEHDSRRVVVTDFGLARLARSSGSLTATGVLIGTPEYWSPEQAMGLESHAPADMYAFGCILYLLLSARLPFDGEDRLAIGLRRAHEDPPSLRESLPHASADTVELVDSLLAREPARRPDAAEAAILLGRHRVRSSVTASRASRVAFAREQPTARMPATMSTLPVDAPPPPPPRPPRRRRRRRTVAALGAAAVATAAAFLVVDELRGPGPRAPNVVALRTSAARAQILDAQPRASVSVTRVYSTRVASGRVIRQQPRPRASLDDGAEVRLIVSKGTPFARVPVIDAGVPAVDARASLERSGFVGHFRYTPSWTIRKGTVIELRPHTGTRLRRPATVKIVVASGYPRAVVPDVREADLASAKSQLEAKHLRYRVVHRLTHTVPADQVLGQIPSAGVTVYQGTRVRLTVARTRRWVTVLSQSGGDGYESDPFTVPGQWRIRYRLAAGDLGPALTRFSWARDGDVFGSGDFLGTTAGDLQTYAVSDGAGTYRLAVSPYAGTTWYVEVDALE